MGRLNWCGETSEDLQGADWQFRYTVPGAEGAEATLWSHGRMSEPLRGERLVDVFRLFDTFCRSWMIAEAYAAAPANQAKDGAQAGEFSAATLRFPAVEVPGPVDAAAKALLPGPPSQARAA